MLTVSNRDIYYNEAMKKYSIPILILLLSVSLIFQNTKQLNSPHSPPSSSTGQVLGQQTKSTSCFAHNGLPDNLCTPGAIIPSATREQICTAGYAHSVRNVSEEEKQQVYAEYTIATRTPGQYEVDHLISLELGGSNDIANLWPEAALPTPGFHEKDRVEAYLHERVCDGSLPLSTAQYLIAHNWLAVYQQAHTSL
jgi:hypothetical protein